MAESKENYEKDMTAMYDIFISYRRDGGESMAVLLHDRLTAKGFKVFVDVESLNSGNFNTQLLNVIENCKDVVLILSENCLDRCVNEGDWVRAEIAYALKHKKNVVPYMLRGFKFPDTLPEDISEISMQNGVNASSNEYFDAAVDRLVSNFLISVPRRKKWVASKAFIFALIGVAVVAAAFVIITAVILNIIKSGIAVYEPPIPQIYQEGQGGEEPPSSVIIDLSEQGITDEMLAELLADGTIPKNTSRLNLSGNQISNISLLENLTDLEELNLSSNLISDISPISELVALKDLRLFDNRITDLTIIDTSESGQITTITPLSGLTDLEVLILGSNQITEISSLRTLTNLTWLNLHDNQITQISPLGELTNLETLSLGNNQISDITVLGELVNLTELFLGNNPITDISPLEKLTYLTELYLADNAIIDISPLGELKHLLILNLNNNLISDISPFAGLTNVRELYLHSNEITDIASLEILTSLMVLNLGRNLITDISPLDGLTNLTLLFLDDNLISDISPLTELKNLIQLDLSLNLITDEQIDALKAVLPGSDVTY
ncbi:MAG: leucine-rich repeat domain-containing protein [Oscillospiraceae bacterium]|nr:leucine-rich repeat domain-containing protein [Oscillospiraceae bacterium]